MRKKFTLISKFSAPKRTRRKSVGWWRRASLRLQATRRSRTSNKQHRPEARPVVKCRIDARLVPMWLVKLNISTQSCLKFLWLFILVNCSLGEYQIIENSLVLTILLLLIIDQSYHFWKVLFKVKIYRHFGNYFEGLFFDIPTLLLRLLCESNYYTKWLDISKYSSSLKKWYIFLRLIQRTFDGQPSLKF